MSYSMKFTLITLVILNLILNIHSIGNDDKCRVLVMRGGGTKGAYESGALKAIINNLKSIEY